MTSFNWKTPRSFVVYGCSCFDRNDCHGCLKYEQHKSNAYPTPKTNADRIRAMSDNELAVFMAANQGVTAFDGSGELYNRWLDWLKQEATNG